MCGRFSLSTPIPDLAELFQADPAAIAERAARYNIAPTEEIVVVRARDDRRELAGLRWGLVPRWAEDPATLPLMINARSESLFERPAFRDLIPDHRCAVPADGFYEWRLEGGAKQPYYVRRRDGRPLALAGLWDRWEGPDGEVSSCTVVTAPASRLLLPLHDRMPVILEEPELEVWLDPEVADPARALDALESRESATLEAYPVSRRVNGVAHDDPSLLDPLGEPVRSEEGWADDPGDTGPATEQLGLF